jgi:DHA1 family bicyclomycin/chloramphenicol resistance-like MFS transporter
MSSGALLFLLAVSTNWGGLGVILPSLFLVLFGLGFVTPNATALALENHPHSAGAASALLGSAQFLFGAGLAPLAGIGGNHDALPMGILMMSLAGGATAVRVSLSRATKTRTAVSLESAPITGA